MTTQHIRIWWGAGSTGPACTFETSTPDPDLRCPACLQTMLDNAIREVNSLREQLTELAPLAVDLAPMDELEWFEDDSNAVISHLPVAEWTDPFGNKYF